jgi:hypothetical protein
MEKNSTSSSSLVFKKDFFIKTRKEDIRQVYEFSPKVLTHTLRSLGEEHMVSYTRLGTNNLLIPTEL